MSKSLWERTVELTIAIGERLLAPVERFIGRRSLVGDATFFELDRFPWVTHIEENWEVIREEVERLLEDQAELANFQDISKDQIEITDDDRWKTFFLYGYGFEAKLGVEMCPRTAALMREIPGMTTAMISILSPRKHILDHRGPYKGVLRYHLGLIVPEDAEACRIRVGEDVRHWEEGRSMVFDDTFNHEVWNDTDETRVVLFVDVLRPLPFPESAINRRSSRRSATRRSCSTPSATRKPGNGASWSARRAFDARTASSLTTGRRPGEHDGDAQTFETFSPVPSSASFAWALSVVNSPVTISSPRQIITAPPTPMITGKWRLTTPSALVIRSNASAISRNGIASPAE